MPSYRRHKVNITFHRQERVKLKFIFAGETEANNV